MDDFKMSFSKGPLIVAAIIIVIFITVITIDNLIIKEELRDVAFLKAEEINSQIEVSLEENIDESLDDLSLLASYLEKNNITSETALDLLKEQSQTEEFETIYYIDINGRGIGLDGSERYFSDNVAFLSVLNNKFTITEPYVSSITGEDVYDVAVPITQNDQIVAVLLSEVSLTDIYESMRELTKGIGDVVLVDYKGALLHATDSAFKNTEDIISEDIDFFGGVTLSQLTYDIENNNKGTVRFDVNGVSKLAIYSPIKDTPWTLFLYVDENKANDGLSTTLNLITQICFVIAAVLVFFTILIWRSKVKTIEEIKKVAYYDSLTELPNLEKLKLIMFETLNKNKDKKYGIIKMDIQNFKAVNEMFGFEVGDKVLKAFKTIRETVNEPSLVITRAGIDEFIIFSGNGFVDDMEERTSIYESYYNKIIPELEEYQIKFKYGRYQIKQGETNVEDILNKVTLAHSISKYNKDKIIFDYDDKYKEELLRQAEITHEMKPAISNKEFKVFLQPKVSVSDNKLIGAEALVRWIKPDGNVTFPDQFIPLFEKNGFIVELDKYMLEETCILLRKWMDKSNEIIPISVNFSRLNLSRENFSDKITEIVDKYEIPHQYIEIELTESTLDEDEEKLEALFESLNSQGFKTAIDDFGSGFSSLGMLKNLKIDILKLDKSFFSKAKNTERGELLVEGIVKLAQSLNMYVVAEGVEEVKQVEFLKYVGCDAAQGYYFAKPMLAMEFEADWLRRI